MKSYFVTLYPLVLYNSIIFYIISGSLGKLNVSANLFNLSIVIPSSSVNILFIKSKLWVNSSLMKSLLNLLTYKIINHKI